MVFVVLLFDVCCMLYVVSDVFVCCLLFLFIVRCSLFVVVLYG